MILLIDNYDSFSYNLFQFIGSVLMENGKNVTDQEFRVIRNDALTVEEIRDLHPDGIVISPGPGRPADAGVCEDVVRQLGSTVPILGVCLGHQGICEAYGAAITYAKELMHGKQSIAILDAASPLFADMPSEIPVARYHSLAVDPDTLPDCLRSIARTADGEVMAVQHVTNPVYGVQFHPESIMTPDGMQIIRNFIKITERTKR